MSELLRLAELCEKASGPDRPLDAAIFYEARVTKSDNWTRESWVAAALREGWNTAPFTASIDAAMTLVPKGWWLESMSDDVSASPSEGVSIIGCACTLEALELVRPGSFTREVQGDAATRPLALCAASLRAGVR